VRSHTFIWILDMVWFMLSRTFVWIVDMVFYAFAYVCVDGRVCV
jgi:hypothetical protein